MLVASNLKTYRKYTDLFIGYLFLFGFLGLVSIVAVLAQDEGQLSKHNLLSFLADQFQFIFPLILAYRSNESFNLFITLLTSNILLYAVLFSYLSAKFIFRLRRYKPFDFTFYSSLFILLLVVAGFISVIVR